MTAPPSVSASAGVDADLGLPQRVRRLWASERDAMGPGTALPTLIRSALDRHDAPASVRVAGCEGSGAGELARLLAVAGVPGVQVRDVDELAVAPEAGDLPDAEVLCLCTAPCGHESAWSTRPRRHRLLVVATRLAARSGPAPAWADGLARVEPDRADDPGAAALAATVRAALAELPALRARRLEDELAVLSARPDATEVLGGVLCAPDVEEHG